MSRRRAVFNQVQHSRSRLCHRIFRVHQNLQCYLSEAKHQQHLFVSQTPSQYRLRQDKHPDTTQTVSQETLFVCLQRSHQLLPGSNAVSVYLTCLECRHHAKWTQRARPTFQEFPELRRKVQAWWATLQRRQGCCVSLCVDGGSDVVLGPCDSCDSCG